MIGIRADANKIIATGHVMRCVTIAKELMTLGERVTFFVADEESKGFTDSCLRDLAGAEVVVLGTSYDHMEDEIPVLEKELSDRKCDGLLVDSYFVTRRYFQRLNRICPVAYMDDLGKEAYPVDLLINYNGFSGNLDYEHLYEGMKGHGDTTTKLLLGLKYAPLRRQFYEQDAHETPASDAKSLRILLASGGGDMHGMVLSTLEAAEKNGLLATEDNDGRHDPETCPTVWEVVLGSMASDASQIEALAQHHSNIHINRNVTNMASLMRSCDLAVTAAGTMLTECAAVHLPAIFFQVADNQKPNTDFWPTTGGMIFAGDVTGGDINDNSAKENVIDTICSHIHDLYTDTNRLSSMKTALSGLTDGTGAIKIANQLISLSQKPLPGGLDI